MNDIKQCVYKYVYGDQIIYIGKTDCSLKQRVYGHSKEDKFQDYLDKSKVYYAELNNSAETSYVELYLINKYKPILNTAFVKEGKPTVYMEEPEWKSWEKFFEENEDIPKPKREKCKSSKPSKQFFSVEEIIEHGQEIVEQYRGENDVFGNAWFFTLGSDGGIEEISYAPGKDSTHGAFKENSYRKEMSSDELRKRYKNNLFVPMILVNAEMDKRREEYRKSHNLNPWDIEYYEYPNRKEESEKLIHDYAVVADVSRVLGYELDLKEINIETIGARQ